MQKIVTTLWFDGQVQEALDFYTAIFPDAQVQAVSHFGDAGPGTPGDIMTAELVLAGQEFIILNGGPQYAHSPAISLLIRCADQAEVDYFWERLIAGGGQPGQCGWLSDRFGISWQVVPDGMDALMTAPDRARADRAMQAMLGMSKIDLAAMQRAFDGE